MVDFPDAFFEPPAERSADWQDEPELRRAVVWLKGFMSAEEWRDRRNRAADALYRTAMGEVIDEAGTGAFFHQDDLFAWILFLADAFMDHPHNYEPMFGSRVVPILTAIGRDLDLLAGVEGVDERVRRMVGPERSQANAGLFELLVAAAYRRAGYAATFVPEQKGRRTHDLDVRRQDRSFAVECKRMETGDYGDAERQRMRELWGPSIAGLSHEGISAICTARLRVTVEEVPEAYLTDKVHSWQRSGQPNLLWSDEVADGSIGELDLGPLQAALAENDVLAAGTRMQLLLSGSYERNTNFSQTLRMKRSANPRYVDECDLAIVLRWETASPVSINNKARDVLRKLVDANGQLPEDRPSVVHVGFEAVEGDAVEATRYAKIIETVATFDPKGKPLEYVYAHYLVPESPPEGGWAFDETTQWIAVRPSGPPPLEHGLLVLPADGGERSGPHWT